MPGGRWLGCLEKRTFFIIISKRSLDIPVLPKAGAGIYLEGAVVDHSDARVENSNRVMRIHTPKNFNISPFVVDFLPFLMSCSEVNVVINVNSAGGNMSRK
eukprot:scaffold214938_cov33-Attheya_sp.AAC.1